MTNLNPLKKKGVELLIETNFLVSWKILYCLPALLSARAWPIFSVFRLLHFSNWKLNSGRVVMQLTLTVYLPVVLAPRHAICFPFWGTTGAFATGSSAVMDVRSHFFPATMKFNHLWQLLRSTSSVSLDLYFCLQLQLPSLPNDHF